MAGGLKKFSQLPADAGPTVNDSIPTYDADTAATRRSLISDLITLFFNNIPAAAATSTTLAQDTMFDFVKPGTGVISADNPGSNRNASITAITCYQNGQKLTLSAVTARAFTASKDTYIDLLNTGGVLSIVYTEVSNNAASPALASNSIRLGIVVTGATTIAAAASINQGQPTKRLPIASSVPYVTNDSLGNIICPRDPYRHTLAYRQEVADSSSYTNTSVAEVPEFSTIVKVPVANRSIKIMVMLPKISFGTTMNIWASIWKTAVGGGGTQLQELEFTETLSGAPGGAYLTAIDEEPGATAVTYKLGYRVSTNGSTMNAATTAPRSLEVGFAK